MAKRAKQAGFAALNVRLPPDLYKRLRQATGTTRSLNAEIIDRLQRSFDADSQNEGWQARLIAYLDRSSEKELRSLAERIDRLEGRLSTPPRRARGRGHEQDE
jgi:hypothetical protein